jgi:hypothetical protein
MGRTFLRQDTQLRNSDVYDDTVTPAEAAFETNPANIETDLNNIRSQLKTLMGKTNWWDTTTRTVESLDGDLTDLEDKRILCGVEQLTDVTVPAALAAINTLTSSAIPNNDDTVTIGAQVYTFKTTLTPAANEVFIGASQALAMENLRRAINDDGVVNTNYGTGTTQNVDVSATDTATTVVATALEKGSHDNSVVTTEVSAVMSWADPATLGGASATQIGAGNQVTLDFSNSETPTTAAAVGAGTALGTIVATLAGDVGTHDIVEVSSTNTSVPKNRLLIRDASIHEGITDAGGRQVYGLLQAENGVVDGEAFNDTDKQVQISFVVIDDSDDLVPVDADAIGGQDIEYVYANRVTLDTIPEDCAFPHFTFTDGGASVSVTLNNAIDNQGVTPATQNTNIDVDQDAGVEWTWRDAASADLVAIIEGSTGGDSEFKVSSAVDLFNIDAADVDFLQGIAVDSGGTEITIGETAGQIDSAGALTLQSGGTSDLKLDGASGDLVFVDDNYAGGTYDTDFNLSDSTGEWDTFETNFGEVSLLNAINQAYEVAGGVVKAVAVVGSTVNADANVSNSDGNTDAALGDLSGGTFIADHDIYLNGQLLRSGANAAANHDVYPGTDLDNTADAQLKFEFKVKSADVITVISRA